MDFDRRVLTLHAELDMPLRLAVLDALEHVLLEHGATRIWIDPGSRPDLVVLAEFGADADELAQPS
jgi:hypothetical protein